MVRPDGIRDLWRGPVREPIEWMPGRNGDRIRLSAMGAGSGIATTLPPRGSKAAGQDRGAECRWSALGDRDGKFFQIASEAWMPNLGPRVGLSSSTP